MYVGYSDTGELLMIAILSGYIFSSTEIVTTKLGRIADKRALILLY